MVSVAHVDVHNVRIDDIQFQSADLICVIFFQRLCAVHNSISVSVVIHLSTFFVD